MTRKEAIEGVPIYLSVLGVFVFSESAAFAVCLNVRLILRCQHFCPGLLHFAVFVPVLKQKSFLCVVCMTWPVSNKISCVYDVCNVYVCVCLRVCEREKERMRLSV